MFVIDPTEQGKMFARRITGVAYGTWEPVTTARELDAATAEAAMVLAQQTERAEKILEQFEAARAAASSSESQSSRLKFTAGYPGSIDHRTRYPLILYVHIDAMMDEVRQRLEDARQSLGAMLLTNGSESSKPMPYGTLLRIRPQIERLFVSPSEQEIVWRGTLEELRYWINYAGDRTDGDVCSGFIDIYSREGLIVGRVPMSISVDAASEQIASLAAPTVQTGGMLDLIFASYAHVDEAIVRACKEAYEALGVRLFIDRDDLLSGQLWRNTIQKMIAKCDLFQLYWSETAAASHNRVYPDL